MSTAKHEARRRRIADIVLRVITQDGLEAATVRRIAAEVGFSTAVVTYYFANKSDLLFSAYSAMGEMNRVKFERFVAHDPPDLVSFLVSMSALDPDDGAAWRACIGLWDRALRDSAMSAGLRSWLGQALQRIEFFIRALHPDCPRPDKIACQLFDLVQGISTHLLFDPQRCSTEELRDLLATEIRLLVEAQSGETSPS